MRSLKNRLLLVSAVFITGALVISWILLTQLFADHVSERLYSELETHINQLIAVVEVDDQNDIVVEETLASPRFNKPFGGLYWKISLPELPELTSRSLWDGQLDIGKSGAKVGVLVRYDDIPFNGGMLLALERTFLLEVEGKSREIRAIVAIDRQDLEVATRRFGDQVLLLVVLLAFLLFAAAGAQIIVGLRPLSQLREKLKLLGYSDGGNEINQLDGEFPLEVQGLVDGLNGLLRERSENVEKARARAADLAHGLKTPLAILAAESRILSKAGKKEVSDEINTQVDVMNRHIERQLVAARTASTANLSGSQLVVKPILENFARIFAKLPRGENLEFKVDVRSSLKVRMDKLDFEEVIGNIMDNACKWARKEIVISAVSQFPKIVLNICDDGPGVAGDQLSTIIERGGRLDENIPGSGLGLAIVSDIVSAYGGKLHIANRDGGGFCVTVELNQK